MQTDRQIVDLSGIVRCIDSSQGEERRWAPEEGSGPVRWCPRAAAVTVALNSLFQVIAFAALGWFYLSVMEAWLGLQEAGVDGMDASTWHIARSVLIVLGLPLLAGYLTRRLGERTRGRVWYDSTFIPQIGPWALYELLSPSSSSSTFRARR